MAVPEYIDPLSFWKEFQLIGSTKNLPGRIEGPRVCRFCGKAEGQVGFRNKSHAVSDLLGRNDFVLFDECDHCNTSFSDTENHLCQFFLPYLAIIGIKGKKDIREFRSRIEDNLEKTRTVMKMDQTRKFNITLNAINDLEIDSVKKTISLTFRQQSLSKLKVYKALVRIALSLLPRADITSYKEVFDWLRNHKNSNAACIPGACVTVLKNVKWEKPGADLYLSRNVEGVADVELFPKLTLIVYFANLIVQIFLVPVKGAKIPDNELPNLNLNYFPAFVQDYALDKELLAAEDVKTKIEIPYNVTFLDLSSEELEECDQIIELKYESEE